MASNRKSNIQKFDDAFDSMARMVATHEDAKINKLAALTVVAYNSGMLNKERCHDFVLDRGEFHTNEAKKNFVEEFARRHSAHYRALVTAAETKGDDGKKLKSYVKVPVSGVNHHMAMGNVTAAIRAVHTLVRNMMRALAGVYNVDNIEKVALRKRDGRVGITIDGEEDHFAAAELSSKAPSKGSNNPSAGADALENTVNSAGFEMLARVLSSKLARLDNVNSLTRSARSELSTLMAQMIATGVTADEANADADTSDDEAEEAA